MNKVKKFIWIPIVLIVALAVAIVVLCFVKVDPVLDNFGGYDRIALLGASNAYEVPDITEGGENITAAALENGLKESGFSIMHAMLEGKYSYGLKLKTEENEDGEKVESTITASEIASYSAIEGEYVIKLYYSKVNTITVGGKEIKYDTVLIRVNESNGEVADMECVPYLSANIDNSIPDDKPNENGVVGSEYYETNILLVKMNTSKMMIDIEEFRTQNEV